MLNHLIDLIAYYTEDQVNDVDVDKNMPMTPFKENNIKRKNKSSVDKKSIYIYSW